MGTQLYDRYSLLHLATGIIAYYFELSLLIWLIIHIIFEMLENTWKGIYFIDNYVKIWPGGKQAPDIFVNSVLDTVFAALGWTIAYYHGLIFPTE